MREPTPRVLQVLAFPIGVVAGVALGLLWLWLTPLRVVSLDAPGTGLLAVALLFPLHELIHAVCHPGSGKSSDSVLGFWPAQIVFYAHYSAELSKGRFIFILLMPLLILSLLPLFVCAVAGCSPVFLVLVSILNALSACGDMLGAGLLVFQVPGNATLRNQGWKTFWKLHDLKAAPPMSTEPGCAD